MNLANQITIIRILLIPIFMYFMYSNSDNSSYIALAIFIIASLTDFLDGYIARKYNMVTNLGKFLDPLADKILVISAMIMFVEKGLLPAWVVVVIVFREFTITGFRTIAASEKIVIEASMWGKWKTTFQMLMIIGLFFDLKDFNYIKTILIGMTILFTLLSGLDYIWKNKYVLKHDQ